MIRRSSCDETRPLCSVAVVLLMALAASPIPAMAVSPAPGSPLDSSDMLVVSDSSTMTVGSFGMARDAAGDFVMVWGQQATAFPNAGFFQVQRFDAAGKPQGSPFQVAASEADGPPSVAMDAAGDFVVAWHTVGGSYQQTATYDVHAQRFDASGTAQGGELLVTDSTDVDDLYPSVAMDAAGDFVIVWQEQPSQGGLPEPSGTPHQIYARRYSVSGVAQGGQFLVTDASTTDETAPNVAMGAAGDFVVAWQTGDQENGGYLTRDILAQRFDAAGSAQGGAFTLSTVTNTGREGPRVAMAATGGFVVVWSNYDSRVQPATGDVQGDVHAQLYDAAGTAQGSELAVNTFTSGDQSAPSVTMDAAGDFAVAWESFDQAAADSSYDVYAQRYSAAGAPVGREFLVNALTEDSQAGPTAAMDADGDMVVAWSSFVASTGSSVYLRRFVGEESVDFGLGATFAPATPSPGSSFSMTLAVTNISATTPTGVSSVDAALGLGLGITSSVTLPAGATYRSAQGTAWTCTGPVSSVLSCSYGAPLSAGNAASPLTIMLTAPSRAGTLVYNAKVESDLKPDAPSAKNSVSGSLMVAGAAGSAGGPGGDPSGGSSGGGDLPAGSSGGGALDILSLAFLGLALLRSRKPRA